MQIVRSSRSLVLLPALLLVAEGVGRAGPLNDFDVSRTAIPVEEILHGGPPRDGIPALRDPRFVEAAESPWRDEEIVVGVEHAGEARAYPLAILVWHELVNDRIADLPVLVSYCPLCGSALVFDRRPPRAGGGRAVALDFGVSGLLYRSDLLMFDRATDSLWSQIVGRAVAGPMTGARLDILRARIEPWGRWRQRHPESLVLSQQTGVERPYGRNPYPDYARSSQLYFPIGPTGPAGSAPLDRRHHPKMRTLGLRTPSGKSRAYPLEEIEAAGGSLEESFAGRPIRVHWDAEAESFDVEAPAEIQVIESYWFAWMAFHPESSVYRAPRP